MRTVFMLALLTAGCSDGAVDVDTFVDDTGDGTDVTTGTDADSDTDTDSDTQPDPNEPATMTGTTFGEGGYPAANIVVRLCQDTCEYATVSDTEGVYTLADIAPGTYMLEVVPPASLGWMTQSAPVTIAANADITLNPFAVQPSETAATPDSESSIELGSSLFVTVDPGALAYPDGQSELSGARVQPEWLAPVALPGELLGAWYLGPYGATHGDDGFGLRFDNEWDLGATESADVYTNAYTDSGPDWILAGTVTGGGDTLSGDVSVPRLATVLLIAQ